MSKSNGENGDRTERGGGGVKEAEEKGKASRRHGVGSREIRDKRKKQDKKRMLWREKSPVFTRT